MTRQKQKSGHHARLPIRPPHQQMGASQAELDAPCARWSRVLPDGSYDLDLDKLRCTLSKTEQNDRLLVRNIIHGTILSSHVFPLIFDPEELVEEPMVRLRSLCYYSQLLEDREQGALTYQALSDEHKIVVAVGVRDLLLAEARALLSEREVGLLHGMIEMLDETLGCVEVMGTNISFHPSPNFRVMHIIELSEEDLGPSWSPLFVNVSDEPPYVVVFVDPAELSYHNMENIVPLDRWIESKQPPGNRRLSPSLGGVSQVQAEREVWTCKLQGAAICSLLKQVSGLTGLYTAPPNKASRGGERFIFHSSILSRALTDAVSKSDLLDGESKLAQGRLASSFEFVNYVFRCNKFAAGDSMFVNHRDTPYYDDERGHVSRYTVLIYLTAGTGNPTLHVHDVKLKAIDEEMTCVIFDQSYEHEGKPFLDNEKIFIRTDLVFKSAGMGHSIDIASLFSTACYMTRQGLLNKELESYANDCFERANSLHWAVEREAAEPPVYLHKHFRGMHFLTNGYNYWFAKDSGSSSGANEIDCAIVAVLDHLNCKINGKAFNSLCGTPVILRDQFKTTKDIWGYFLRSESDIKAAPLKRLKVPDVDSLINKGPDGKGLAVLSKDDETSDEGEDNKGEREEHEGENEDEYFTCCPDCRHPGSFNAWRSPLVRRSFRKSWKFTRAALLDASLLVFDQELVINESNVEVVGDKIFFRRSRHSFPLRRVNFAGCWDSFHASVPSYLDIDQEIGAMNLQLPPVIWHEFEEGYQLVLDLFRNDWMIGGASEQKIPVPIITNDPRKGERPLMKSLNRVYRSGEFGRLFDTFSNGLDSESQGLLTDKLSHDENEEDKDEGKGRFSPEAWRIALSKVRK